MKILIIQENGRREENRAFRECFALQRAFAQIGVACGVWGLGHENFTQPFESVVREYDAVLSLDNYPGAWHPDLASVRLPKMFWCIDAHMGLARYEAYVCDHRFDVVFSATEMFVPAFARLAAASEWLPNALDATLIDRTPGVAKDIPLGFCGNTATRTVWLDQLNKRWNLRHDRMVLGVEMVRAIQRYQIHWNRNVSVDVNFRTFETLGCETFLLTNHMAGLNQLFTPGQHLATYVSLGELHEKIDYYLAHPEERGRIARQGYEHVRAHHTYVQRAQQILKQLQGAPCPSIPPATPAERPTSAAGANAACRPGHKHLTEPPLHSTPTSPALWLYGKLFKREAKKRFQAQKLVEHFTAGDYEAATVQAEQLMEAELRSTPTKPLRRLWRKLSQRPARKWFQKQAEIIANLCGAAFREERHDLALRLAHTLLGWHPRHRRAIEILGKITGGDTTYRTTDNPTVPEVQVAAYRAFGQRCAGGTVIEVGCGLGMGTKLLTDAGARVLATDYEETCLRYAKEHFGCAVDYRQCSATALPFADQSFDFATCVDVIEHIADYDQALTEMRRVTRKAVLFATPNRLPENTNPDGTPRNYWHQFEWTPEEIRAALARIFPRFEVHYVVEHNGHFDYRETPPGRTEKIAALVGIGYSDHEAHPGARKVAVRTAEPRLHLVYAGDPQNDASRRAPESIGNHLLRYFEARYPVRYADWRATGPLPLGPDDILLGHPHYGRSTVVQRAFREGRCRAKLLLFPFHHGMPEINLPFDSLVRQCDQVCSITGEYWHRTLSQSPFAHWQEKMIRVDMAVDLRHFPQHKRRFAPPGQRTLFYLGSDAPEKGGEQLAALVRATGMRLVCAGRLNRIRRHFRGLPVTFWGGVTLDDVTLQRIAAECDFFVNPSVSDANPTTILEMAALGLPVFCTQESGYEREDLVYRLKLNDSGHNLAVLNAAQQADEAGLLARTARVRAILEQEYTWEKFCQTVGAVVEAHWHR